MFWVFLGAVSAAVVLFNLGALSVWVGVLGMALRLAVLIGLVITIYAVWNRLKRPR
jgi:hypothetical protein